MKRKIALIGVIVSIAFSSILATNVSAQDMKNIEKEDGNIGQEYIKNNVEKVLTLDDAIKYAIENSMEIKNSDLEIRVKELQRREARSNERKYADASISLGTVEGFQLDANMLSKSAEFALEEEKIRAEYTKENLKYNVTNAYYACIKAIEAEKIAESTLENLARNLEIVEKKYDLGVVSKSDFLMAEIGVNEGKANLENAKVQKQAAIRALNMLLNFPLDTNLELISDFELKEFETDLEKDIEDSYKKRFDMIQMNNNYQLVKLDYETNAIVYPENTYNYKYKKNNLAKMENILNNIESSVELDIRGKYDAMINAKNQIKLAESNVEKAKEGVRLINISYDVDMSTTQEVRETTVQLHNAELAYLNAVYNYNLSILDYKKAINLGNV